MPVLRLTTFVCNICMQHLPPTLTDEELEALSSNVVSFSPCDEKVDRFPSRNRPALVFLWLHEAIAEIAPLLKLSAPEKTAIDGLISSMTEFFQAAELIARMAMPSPYAQINRLAILCFLLLMPFALAKDLGMLLLPTMFCAHTIYFGLEKCANAMEVLPRGARHTNRFLLTLPYTLITPPRTESLVAPPESLRRGRH